MASSSYVPRSVSSTLAALSLSYLDTCRYFNRKPNPFIPQSLQLLQAEHRKHTGSSKEITLKIAGNNHLIPVQRLSDEDLEILTYVLRPLKNVTGLDVRYNLITDKGALAVQRLLQEMQNITYLNLMFNDIKTEGGEVIAKALHRNQTLKHLRMTGNKIENKGGMFFAAMLQINSSLEKLDLGDCDLEESTIHISHMLKTNSTLIELHMCKHDIKNFGMQRLCEALSVNTCLRYLDVSCNRITCDAMKYLGELLKSNNVLEVIDLSSNRIEDEGSMYLAEALAFYNTSLKALSIVSNNITGRGLTAFSNSMKTNTTLSNIYIWGNKFDNETCVAFANLITSGRLKLDNIDVEPYVVDNCVYLAELSHGIKKHYYWTPSYGEIDGATANAGLALVPTAKNL
ncbi:leucine-rich repeat-containing protein 34 isoform X2 [Macrotis lagotis]|uniref:leucine-rich repeat-containing protein 34 isoform X2 n=1 Tax=Macrotis lagotis TaxID=92651 RepID=UPI003D692068